MVMRRGSVAAALIAAYGAATGTAFAPHLSIRYGAMRAHTATAAARLQCSMLTPLPDGDKPYGAVMRECTAATQAAIKNGVSLIELEFPPVKGKLDISLGETLDANRGFARELMRAFSAKMGKALWAVFADPGEAKLAAKAFTGGASGSLPFRVTSIKEALGKRAAADGGCDLQLVVQPGFNIDEWIQLDTLYAAGAKARQAAGAAGQPSMVVLNGSLDKVRGGYYPKLVYPGLHAAKDRFIKNFEPVYYLKALPEGWLFRRYPEDWQVIYAERGSDPVVLQTSSTRPEYNNAAKLIKAAALERQMIRRQL